MIRARVPHRPAQPAPARGPVPAATRKPVSNQALQAKLEVGPVDDPLEREADTLADRVVRRKCAACAHEDDDQTLRLKPAEGSRAPADAAVAGLRGGTLLPAAERRFFEAQLGRDFSAVRVHADSPGAVAIGARAFTLDRQIAFAPGEWRPGTVEGRRLLAHELVHVVQQRHGAERALRRQPAHGQRTTCVGDVCFEETPGAPTPSGPGGTTMRGDVARREYVRGDPSRVVHQASVGLEFDPIACTATVPHIVRFQQPPSGTWGSCEGPPAPGAAVANVSQTRLNSLQTEFLQLVNERLNGWYEVRLEGNGCPGTCRGQNIPIRVRVGTSLGQVGTSQSSVSTVTPVNRRGRSYVQGNDIVLCMGDADIGRTIPHEGVHFALGHGDEYRETEKAVAARDPRGQYSPEREIEGGYSLAGSQHEHGRFAMLHERHFQFVPAFLERLYPGCRASLVELERPRKLDFRLHFATGYASINQGGGGIFDTLGVGMGIPLDRLRRWEAVLGANATFMLGSDKVAERSAFLFGARLALEYRTSPGQGGFRLGGFAELGAGRFSASGSVPGAGSFDRNVWAPYGEVGLGAGYRFGTGSRRLSVGLEGAASSTLSQPGVIGPVTPEIERDPVHFKAFRLGLTIGGEF